MSRALVGLGWLMWKHPIAGLALLAAVGAAWWVLVDEIRRAVR